MSELETVTRTAVLLRRVSGPDREATYDVFAIVEGMLCLRKTAAILISTLNSQNPHNVIDRNEGFVSYCKSRRLLDRQKFMGVGVADRKFPYCID